MCSRDEISSEDAALWQNCHSTERTTHQQVMTSLDVSLGSREGKAALSLSVSGLNIPAWLHRSSSCTRATVVITAKFTSRSRDRALRGIRSRYCGRGETAKRVMGGQCLLFYFCLKIVSTLLYSY